MARSSQAGAQKAPAEAPQAPKAPQRSGGTPKAATIGKQAKTTLPAELFTEPFCESLVHEVARADMAARRRGTASTLRRAEVAMTGAKAWRQKGTGRARAGALSTPQRRGGGVAFGPKPRRYTLKVNRKVRRRALRAALSVHADRGSIAVLPADAFAEPATKEALEGLERWGAERPVLVVLGERGEGEVRAAKSYRNLPRVEVRDGAAVGVDEIVGARSLVVSEAALELLARRAAEVQRGVAGAAAEEAEEVADEPSEPDDAEEAAEAAEVSS